MGAAHAFAAISIKQFRRRHIDGHADFIRPGLLKRDHGKELIAKPEPEAISFCAKASAGLIIKGIRKDLESFGVSFDEWFSEQSLYDSGSVDTVIQELEEKEIVYKKDGAVWFKTTDFGHDKDRVIIKSTGEPTYRLPDIAYHREKFKRGYDWMVDIFGSDHIATVPDVSFRNLRDCCFKKLVVRRIWTS